MGQEWEFVITQKIRDNNRYLLPEEAEDHIVFDHFKGPSVHWHIETNNEYIVLSNEILTKANYQHISRSKVYSDRSVKLPGDLLSEIDSFYTYEYSEEELRHVTFAAYDDMLDENPKSVFLFSEEHTFELLPPDVEGSDIKSRILNAPGFVPPV